LTPEGKVSTTVDKENASDIGFSQVNVYQNRNLINYLLKKLNATPDSSILDLYCGSGNFTIPIADQFLSLQIVGVDNNKTAIGDAKKKVQKRELNIQFHCDDVLDYLKTNSQKCDIVIIDPPRIGCDQKVLELIAKKLPQTIVYISCNPMTFNRDVNRLHKFMPDLKILEAKPFDMFPHTEHCELIALMELAN